MRPLTRTTGMFLLHADDDSGQISVSMNIIIAVPHEVEHTLGNRGEAHRKENVFASP